MAANPIALLTDFGDLDAYVGAVKGVLLGLAPDSRQVDLTHHVPAGDVRRGAFVLWQAVPYFPAGTVFLAVVDPGVGTARRGLALQLGGRVFVGPDNGLFTFVLATGGEGNAQAVELRAEALGIAAPSPTFHGRDLFAPAAARLARGGPLAACGPPAPDPIRFPLPRLEADGERGWLGEIVTTDAFGNAITSLGTARRDPDGLALSPWLPVDRVVPTLPDPQLELPDGQCLPIGLTFAAVGLGQPLAYVGSSGLLEIAVNRGRAAEKLGLAPGTPIRLTSGRRSAR